MADSSDNKNHVDLFNPPLDAETMFEQIKLARMLKEEAAEHAQKRSDAIAAMPPLEIKNDHVIKLSNAGSLERSGQRTSCCIQL